MYSLLCSKKFYFTFLIIFSSTIVFAQTGSISGTVKTSDGSPAEFVNIALKGTTKGTTVSAIGNYSISNIKPGTYQLVASFTGLITQSQTVVVTANQKQIIDFILSENNQQLQEVIVGGHKVNKFTVKKSATVAKIELNNLENPQAYTAITSELIQDQEIVTYADILKNVPGVSLQLQNNGNTPGGTVATRGFSGGAYLRNGLPGMTVGVIDPVNLETLEAIKGPSGTLFGSSLTSFGGVFNRVTKKPFDTFKGNISYSGGSYGLSRVTADINTPLNADTTLMFRITGAKHYEGSFQDAGYQSYTFVAPSLVYKASERLTISIDGEYMDGRFNNFYRLFADGSNANGVHTPADLGIDFNRRFIGDDINYNASTGNFYAQVDYKLSSSWKSQTNFSYSSTYNSGPTAYMSMLPGNKQLVIIASQTDYAKNAMTDIQQNFTGDVKIAGLRNRILVGLDYYHNESHANGASLIFDTLNVANPGAAYGKLTREALMNKFAGATFTKNITNQDTYSAYVQDVINITDQLIALASIRVDNFNNNGTFNPVTTLTAAKYSQTSFAPRFGLVYQVIKDKVSLFGNYMNGFQNVAPVTQPDATISAFKPQQANQTEGGVKFNLLDGKLSSTISYYDIKVNNTVRLDPNKVGFSIQNGNQVSKGLEADVNYNPFTGLNLIAGYAYNDSKYINSAANVDGLRPPSAGPKTMVNAWASYRFSQGDLKGFGLGFGGNYASENYTTLTTTSSFVLPAYTVLNAALSYDQPKYRIGLKCNDLNNEKYYIGWGTTIPQAPRTYIAEFTLKF